ncbi:hypothetical protein EST38_g2078 [Candolleomyces aberdarensis]|uniref:Uncharacterized protein n=1 Tax=Candolleomyces aberdarensis TaxID=2316362 RepID=A0A4Q2DVU2_9AGAR|nr:hypothetical protein EST38_g2078 [Candolleomyces aberdarensis]
MKTNAAHVFGVLPVIGSWYPRLIGTGIFIQFHFRVNHGFRPVQCRLFAKNGYSVALIARGADSLTKISDEINSAGGQAAPFPLKSYSHEDIATTWAAIKQRFPKPEYEIRAAVWNVGQLVWKPFLEITPEDVQLSLDTGVAAAFAFARQSILSFKENGIDSTNGKRGALIFTGATASIRGNVVTSAIAAAKHGARALSQSLAKEFGKDNIHVSHVIVDGVIITDRVKESRNDPSWENNDNLRLRPESIAESYLYLANQDNSSWTWELDSVVLAQDRDEPLIDAVPDESCAELDCLCNSENNQALLSCMNCLYRAGPERPTYEAAQQTLREFSVICDDFSLDMLTVTTTTATSTRTSTSSSSPPSTTATAAPSTSSSTVSSASSTRSSSSASHAGSSTPTRTASSTSPATTSGVLEPSPQKCYLVRGPNQQILSRRSNLKVSRQSPTSPSSSGLRKAVRSALGLVADR